MELGLTATTVNVKAALLNAGEVPSGFVPDPGAESTIALFCGARTVSLTRAMAESHYANPGLNQIFEQNVRAYASVDDAKTSFSDACRAAQAFVSFTGGAAPPISVTTMPMPNYGDETLALRLEAPQSLAAVASHVRIGALQVTLLIAGGIVDPRLLVTITHRAVEKAKTTRL